MYKLARERIFGTSEDSPATGWSPRLLMLHMLQC